MMCEKERGNRLRWKAENRYSFMHRQHSHPERACRASEVPVSRGCKSLGSIQTGRDVSRVWNAGPQVDQGMRRVWSTKAGEIRLEDGGAGAAEMCQLGERRQ
jgi:hypothetical protein